MPEPGELLGKSYRILEVLSGGMGEVFICEWITSPPEGKPPESADEVQRIALKTFHRRYFFDHAVRLSFIREASSWLRLAGLPHIMPVLGIETIDDRPFVLMPAVTPGPRGERNLADVINSGSVDPGLALDYAFQLAFALREASKRIPGICHGDLKPGNVLLLNGDAYLADFGLVSAAALGRADRRLEGTWAYRAPELWTDDPPSPSVASDIYAFGVLLYELLAGTLPFSVAAHERDEWQAAHEAGRPTVPANYPSDGMPAAILALALECLSKNPADRPSDFSKLFLEINKIYQEFDILRHFARLTKTREQQVLTEQLPKLREQRISSLLELDEPAQALEELDAIPEDKYDAMLWMRRGTALSLLNRDEEALTCFNRALTGNLSRRDKDNCESELALSLKRLGRFDEARAVYERLLESVPADSLAPVVVNLATVYLQQRDGAGAVQLLEPLVRRNPDVAGAWANLGQAYVFVGRYSEAETAYGRALGLAPQVGQIRVMLAALYMDHLGQLDAAWSALDAAFDTGYESREWIVRTLACSLLLERRDTLAGLAVALRDNFEPDLAQKIREEGIVMAENLAKKYSEHRTEGVPDGKQHSRP
jgi:serine/threonine protein kinase